MRVGIRENRELGCRHLLHPLRINQFVRADSHQADVPTHKFGVVVLQLDQLLLADASIVATVENQDERVMALERVIQRHKIAGPCGEREIGRLGRVILRRRSRSW